MSSYQLDSKNDSPVLLFKTICRYCNYFLLSVATDSKDGHGFKLEKLGQLFQVLMVCLQKSPKHCYVKCFLNKFVLYFISLLEHFIFVYG